MTEAGRDRPPVIDKPLADTLKPYLRFRHFFRHAYAFDLEWAKMKPLVEGLDSALSEFERQVRLALDAPAGPE